MGRMWVLDHVEEKIGCFLWPFGCIKKMQDMLFFDDDPYNIQDRGPTGCQNDQKPGDVMMFVG